RVQTGPGLLTVRALPGAQAELPTGGPPRVVAVALLLLLRATLRTPDGDVFTYRASVRLRHGRIPKATWFIDPPLRRHLRRQILLGQYRGRVGRGTGLVVAWRLRGRE